MVAALFLAMILLGDFQPDATLPKRNVHPVCGGANVSPRLHWDGAPRARRSFALTAFDPDAPGGGFWHWIVYDIPPATQILPENSGAREAAGTGIFARNDFEDNRYDGPCPPSGPAHRYVFTIYALDVAHIRVTSGETFAAATRGHVLAKAELTGRYGR